MTQTEIRDLLARFPRFPLVQRPTPMKKLERLSAALGGPAIWVKRDDLTGMAFGGNKSRKLEFVLPDVLAKKADTVVTWAGLQSNWAMQTAAACRMAGLRPVLLLFKTYDLPPDPDGNVLLDRILGAEIHFREAGKGKLVGMEEALTEAAAVAASHRAKGASVYLVPVGGSMTLGDMDRPLGALAYLEAFIEMLDQARDLGFEPDAVLHATGSGATQAGLVVGARRFSPGTKVYGISVSDKAEPFARVVKDIIVETEAELSGMEPAGEGGGPERPDVIVLDGYLQAGYGIVTGDVAAAIRRLFETEGIVLDPVYTSKAFIGLVDLVAKGTFGRGGNVVFFHTGGTPALFPNRERILSFLP
jgi:1-aminocyclopropane-1-carboxylate deaminase/D-cysteine desulfhydrase-like pyridoxal-dependent ACC family enzyme